MFPALEYPRLCSYGQAQQGIKMSDVVKNKGSSAPAGLKQTDAALFARAQFTPDEVSSLRKQFQQFDFVCPLYTPVPLG